MSTKTISKKKLLIRFLKEKNLFEDYMSFFTPSMKNDFLKEKPIYRLIEDLKFVNCNRYYYSEFYYLNKEWRKYVGSFLKQSNTIKKFLKKNKFLYFKLKLICFIYSFNMEELFYDINHCERFFIPEHTFRFTSEEEMFFYKVSTKWLKYLDNLNYFDVP